MFTNIFNAFYLKAIESFGFIFIILFTLLVLQFKF